MYRDVLMEKTGDHIGIFTRQAYLARGSSHKSQGVPLPGGLIRRLITNLSSHYDLAAWEVLPAGDEKELEAVRAVLPLNGGFFSKLTRGATIIALTKVHYSLYEGNSISLTDDQISQLTALAGSDQIFSVDDYNYEMIPLYMMLVTEDFDALFTVLEKVRPKTDGDFFEAVAALAEAVVVIDNYAVIELMTKHEELMQVALEGIADQLERLPDARPDEV